MIKILNLKNNKIDTLKNQLKEIIAILEQFKNQLVNNEIIIGDYASYKIKKTLDKIIIEVVPQC